jgi:formate dehydrogenase accessory protein FdhD
MPPAIVDVPVDRWVEGTLSRTRDAVADEWPVAFRYHGVAHVVMLATPLDLEDLAVGFTLSEGIVASFAQIRRCEVARQENALSVDIDIAAERFSALLGRQRNMTGRTGCGLCGAETVEDAIRDVPAVSTTLRLGPTDVQDAIATLAAHQPLNARSGSVHAAGWAVPGRGVTLVREDVGRHNAVDKLIGALVRGGQSLSAGFLVVTSRASYEIVQKAATVGISTVVAVSAPTAFAIRSAERFGITLVGFARTGRHVLYAHGERFATSPEPAATE